MAKHGKIERRVRDFDKNPVTGKQTNRENEVVIPDELMNGNCKRIMEKLTRAKSELST